MRRSALQRVGCAKNTRHCPVGPSGFTRFNPQVNQQVVLDAAEFWNGNNEVMRCQPAASCSLTTSIRFPQHR